MSIPKRRLLCLKFELDPLSIATPVFGPVSDSDNAVRSENQLLSSLFEMV